MSAQGDVKENNQNGGYDINENNSGNMNHIHFKTDNNIISFYEKTTAENHENVMKTESIIVAEENMQSITLTEETNDENNAWSITTNNVTEENSLLTSDSEVQVNGAELNQTTNSNLNNEQENGKLETVKDLATFLFFFIYLADIVTDIIVALKLLSIGNYLGYFILSFVYLSSFYCTSMERDIKNLTSFLLFIIIFILNISGVIVYIEIMLLVCRKLRKKTYDKNLLNLKQEAVSRIKATEACLEALPQLFVQSLVICISAKANGNIQWFQYVSVGTSVLGIILSIRVSLDTFAQHVSNISLFGKALKWLWLIFDTGLFLTLLFTTYVATIVLDIIYVHIILLWVNLFLGTTFYFSITSEDDDRNKFGLIWLILMYSTYYSFERKCLHPRKAIIARMFLTINTILTTIIWYYACNNDLLRTPFLYDLVNYISIVCCFLGLVIIILVVLQICRLPKVRRIENIVSEFFSY